MASTAEWAPIVDPTPHRTPPDRTMLAPISEPAPQTGEPITLVRPPSRRTLPPARQVRPRRPLQCVPYARARSGIEIRGDAWTWWRAAVGHYQRGRLPAVGAVLVLKRKGRSRGHLAYVERLVSDREIVVDHANWLNRGMIHDNARVRDVSPGNDWSQVKIWYTPGQHYGRSIYRPYGFIYPLKSRTGETISQHAPSGSPDAG